VLVAKSSDRGELRLSGAELREVHLALSLRVAALTATNTSKMGPKAKKEFQHHIDLCKEVHAAVQKARGK
jgi:hypothetical protein